MGDAWNPKKPHRIARQQENAAPKPDVPAVPVWVSEWGWVILGTAALFALLMVNAVDNVLGAAEAQILAIALGSLSAVLWWYGYVQRRRLHTARADRATLEALEAARIDLTTWPEFETHCRQVLQALGYREVRKTRDVSREKAVDITAIAPDGSQVAVECKHWNKSVGVPVIRNVIAVVTTGIYKGRTGMLMTSAAVTKEARELAAEGSITVVDRFLLKSWTVEARERLEDRTRRQQGRLVVPDAGETRDRRLRDALAGRIQAMSGAAQFTITAVSLSAVTVLVIVIQALASSPARPAAAIPDVNGRPGAPPSQLAGPARPQPGQPAPTTVVRDFFTAISQHDWVKVWELGGKNLGRGPYRSYNGMIAGYRGTVRDLLLTTSEAGATVSGEFLAYESDGTVRRYSFSYVVHRGAIMSGYQVIVG